MYPSELHTKIEKKQAHKVMLYNFTVTFSLTLDSAMFNGQMLFDRQMHVKIVCNLQLLYNLSYTEDVENNFNICRVVLQDEKSVPPEDFRQVEKSPQLPREYTVTPPVSC